MNTQQQRIYEIHLRWAFTLAHWSSYLMGKVNHMGDNKPAYMKEATATQHKVAENLRRSAARFLEAQSLLVSDNVFTNILAEEEAREQLRIGTSHLVEAVGLLAKQQQEAPT